MKLQVWRKKKKVRQQDLAKLLGITPATLSRYEGGKRSRLDRKILEKIIIVTEGKVTPNDFFENVLEKFKK